MTTPRTVTFALQLHIDHSLDWQVLFVPRVKTTMAQTRSFVTIGPSLH